MSTYIITQEDIDLLKQRHIQYQIRFEVLNPDGTVLDEIEGIIQSGGYSIDANSDVRRTVSLTVAPTRLHPNNMTFGPEGNIWINKTIHLFISIYNPRTKEYKPYSAGFYEYTSVSGTYDNATNTLSLSLNDFMITLNGTKNGEIGALNTTIPAYKEDPKTGRVISYNTIRDAMKSVLNQLGKIDSVYIDEIGEAQAMKRFNRNYLSYRSKHPTWASVPYDLEFSVGCNVLDIVRGLRDLYPNYETFFDPIDNTFVCQMIPSVEDDIVVLDNDFFSKVLIRQDNVDVDLTTVRNICEVWGEVIEADFYTDTVSVSSAGNTFTATISNYTEYKARDTIAVKLPATNTSSMYLRVNSLATIPVYNKETEAFYPSGYFERNVVYVFEIENEYRGGGTTTKAYLLGHFQVHAMDVLTDGTVGEVVRVNNTSVQKYSQRYFQLMYNCENVNLTVIPDSPFTVQKLGERLSVKSGGTYDAIRSDSNAKQMAIYDNWKNSRLTDSITITTLMIPFIDVNTKVSFKPEGAVAPNEYVVSHVNHNLDSLTSSISMYRFYPLYNN